MIAYSLGNYVSNMSIPHGDVGLVVELTLEKRGYVTRIKQFDYDLVWTERAALSRTANFRIIPSDTIPNDLSMNAQLHMQKAINTEKDFLKNTLK
jgi:poly-gamma-glutamate synthesis protein (capsule biosynthesis protein)